MRVARSTIPDLLNKPQPAKAPAKAEGATDAAPRTGLMAQLFGKK